MDYWSIILSRKENSICTSEGGELARSTEIGKMFMNNHIIMQSTGAFASHKNGIDEKTHRTYSEMIRSMIYWAGEKDNRWYYALSYATFIKRRWSNKGIITPYELWFKKKPDTTACVNDNPTGNLEDVNKRVIFYGYAATTS